MNTQRDEARIANTKRGNEHIAESRRDKMMMMMMMIAFI